MKKKLEALSRTLPPVAPGTFDLVMFRTFARGSGEYVSTSLTVRGSNGKVAHIDDLSPVEIGKLTRAGVKKL